jgi:hypothetical protein
MIRRRRKETIMAVARVVAFDGVSSERVEQLRRDMSEGERPEGMPDTEAIVLHDPESEKSLVVLIFETDDDYARAHEILDAMPASDTPGSRTSVQKYAVAHRYKD